MMKPDKLRGECENSQATEELAVCTEEWSDLRSNSSAVIRNGRETGS